MSEVQHVADSQAGRHRPGPVKSPRPDILRIPLALRIVVGIFVFTTIFDSFTFTFLDKRDNLAQLVGIVLAALFLVVRGFHLRFRERDLRWFLVFFAITAVEELIRYGGLGPSAAAFSLRNYFSYFQVFILFIIFRDLSRDPRVFRGVMTVFFLTYFGGALLTDLGIQTVTKEAAGGRVGLVGVNLNGYAFSLAVIVVASVSWALARWPRLGWKGWILMASLFVLLPVIASTGSRGGALALVFGLFVALVLNIRLRRVPVYLVLVPVFLGAVLHVMLNTEIMQRRIHATFYEQDYGSRDTLAEASLVLFRQHPFMGSGPGYVEDLGRIMGREKIAAHNTYLQMLLSFGLLGTLPFLVAFGSTLYAAWRVRGSPWGGIWFAILAMTAAFGMTGHLGYNKHFWMMLAMGGNVGTLIAPVRWRGFFQGSPFQAVSDGLAPGGTGPVRNPGIGVGSLIDP